MVHASTRTSPRRTPRRSKRLRLCVPVQVHGRDMFGDSFREFTRTVSVSAHGGLLPLAARVQKNQAILILNKNTGQELECIVVYLGPLQDGKWTVGIEFARPAIDFWKIHFPSSIPDRPRSTRN